MEKNNEPEDGSFVLPVRRSEGVAGASREVSKTDAAASGADGAGQENNELAWARRHVKDDGPGESGAPRVRKPAIDFPEEELGNRGDLVFLLFDHMDRVGERQDRKIAQLAGALTALARRTTEAERRAGLVDRRMTSLEERGRQP